MIGTGTGRKIKQIYDNTVYIEAEVEIIEHHFHRRSRTFGKSADQSGDNWATEDSLTPFSIISGAAAYGSDVNDEAKLFGPDDSPFIAGQTYFDIAQFLVVGVSNDNPFILRFVWGTGTIADAIIAGQYSTKIVKFDSANPTVSAGIPEAIGIPPVAVGTKIWCQCKNSTNNATIQIFITGAHGYPAPDGDF